MESRTTGRRPKRSEREPRTGEKKNCMAAKTVPKRPSMRAAELVSPWRKPAMRRGRTGAIMPRASMSRVTVRKMKVAAARRGLPGPGSEGGRAVSAETSSGSVRMRVRALGGGVW